MDSRPPRLGPHYRVVIDTGVVVSALVFEGGRLTWLRECWQKGGLLPLISRETASELLRVLAYPKFRLTTAEQQALLAEYLPRCEAVLRPAPTRGLPRCRDLHDRPFLALAVAGRADFLVSGDDDLLAIAANFAIPIVTPSQLRKRISAED